MDSKPHAIINTVIISTRSPVCVYWLQVHIRVHAATRPGAVLRLRTGGRLVAAHRPDADVVEVGDEQRAVRRHGQRGGRVEARVGGVALVAVETVAVDVVLAVAVGRGAGQQGDLPAGAHLAGGREREREVKPVVVIETPLVFKTVLILRLFGTGRRYGVASFG